MKAGDMVKINKCDVCPGIVGKTAKVVDLTSGNETPGFDAVRLNFGRGRPQVNRPMTVNVDDVSLVKE
jgi:hypothetical protein